MCESVLGSVSELGAGVLGAFIKFIGSTVCLHDSPSRAAHTQTCMHSGILLILMSCTVYKKGKNMLLHYMHGYSLTVRPSKAEKIQKIHEKQNEAPVEEP